MDRRIFFQIIKAEQAINHRFKRLLAEAGLIIKPGQTGLLFLLEKKNGQTMSELSSSLEMDNSSVTRIVDRLEKSGFVKRETNSSDRREYRIMITESGLHEIKRSKGAVKIMNRELMNEFSDEELVKLSEFLTRMNKTFRGD